MGWFISSLWTSGNRAYKRAKDAFDPQIVEVDDNNEPISEKTLPEKVRAAIAWPTSLGGWVSLIAVVGAFSTAIFQYNSYRKRMVRVAESGPRDAKRLALLKKKVDKRWKSLSETALTGSILAMNLSGTCDQSCALLAELVKACSQAHILMKGLAALQGAAGSVRSLIWDDDDAFSEEGSVFCGSDSDDEEFDVTRAESGRARADPALSSSDSDDDGDFRPARHVLSDSDDDEDPARLRASLAASRVRAEHARQKAAKAAADAERKYEELEEELRSLSGSSPASSPNSFRSVPHSSPPGQRAQARAGVKSFWNSLKERYQFLKVAFLFWWFDVRASVLEVEESVYRFFLAPGLWLFHKSADFVDAAKAEAWDSAIRMQAAKFGVFRKYAYKGLLWFCGSTKPSPVSRQNVSRPSGLKALVSAAVMLSSIFGVAVAVNKRRKRRDTVFGHVQIRARVLENGTDNVEPPVSAYLCDHMSDEKAIAKGYVIGLFNCTNVIKQSSWWSTTEWFTDTSSTTKWFPESSPDTSVTIECWVDPVAIAEANDGRAMKRSGKQSKVAAYRKLAGTHHGRGTTFNAKVDASPKGGQTKRNVSAQENMKEKPRDLGAVSWRKSREQHQNQGPADFHMGGGRKVEHARPGHAIIRAPHLYKVRMASPQSPDPTVHHKTDHFVNAAPVAGRLMINRHGLTGWKGCFVTDETGKEFLLPPKSFPLKTVSDWCMVAIPQGAKFHMNKLRHVRRPVESEFAILHFKNTEGHLCTSIGRVDAPYILGAEGEIEVFGFDSSTQGGACGGLYFAASDGAIIGVHGMGNSDSKVKPAFYPLDESVLSELQKLSQMKPESTMYNHYEDHGYRPWHHSTINTSYDESKGSKQSKTVQETPKPSKKALSSLPVISEESDVDESKHDDTPSSVKASVASGSSSSEEQKKESEKSVGGSKPPLVRNPAWGSPNGQRSVPLDKSNFP